MNHDFSHSGALGPVTLVGAGPGDPELLPTAPSEGRPGT